MYILIGSNLFGGISLEGHFSPFKDSWFVSVTRCRGTLLTIWTFSGQPHF